MRRISLANDYIFYGVVGIVVLATFSLGLSALPSLIIGAILAIALINQITRLVISRLNETHLRQIQSMRAALHEIITTNPAFLSDCFALWLRPFHTDISIGFVSERSWFAWLQDWIPFKFWTANILFDINEAISDTVAQWTPVVAIGEPAHVPKDQLVCYLTVDDNHWKSTVGQLIDLATVIIFMPDTTEGTIWELQEIHRTGRLAHTVFLMPGENRFAFEDTSHGGKAPFDPREEWRLAQAGFLEHRVHLPDFRAEGSAFTLIEKDGEIRLDRLWSMEREAETVDQMRDNFAVVLQAMSEILEDGPEWEVV